MTNSLRLEYINLLPWRRARSDEELGIEDDYYDETRSTRSKSVYTSNRESAPYSLNEGDLDLLGFVNEENALLQENGDSVPYATHRLRIAVEMIDVTGVESWLKSGADPNYSFGPIKVRCIHLAVNRGNLEITSILIKAGADVNVADARGITPLHVAASSGVVGMIQLLVRSGANVNVRDFARENGSGEETPLHRAAFRGHPEAIRKLIALGAQIDAEEGSGRTPLMVAAQKGFAACIQMLLDYGADPNLKDKKGTTALLLLGGNYVMRGIKRATLYSENVEILLRAGAQVNVKDPVSEITPLHQAVFLGRIEATKLILSAGALLNVQDREGNTPIHICCLRGHSQILKLLLGHQDCDINLPDSKGRSPLIKAAYRGSTECIKILLNAGADLGARTKSGVSAVTLILQLPNGVKLLSKQFDESITTNGIDPSEYTCRLKFDYSVLFSKYKNQQMSVVEDILDDRKTGDLVQHPLIASFLFLKWKKIRMLFFSNVITYLLLVLGVTTYVWTILNTPQQDGTMNNTTVTNITSQWEWFPHDPTVTKQLQLSLKVVIGTILCQEVVQFASLHSQYYKEAENYIKWGALITSSIVIFSDTRWTGWMHYVAAWALLLDWTEVTLLLGRLPSFGVYALMFYSVAQHLAKFIFVFAFFLAGFAFSFIIIFAKEKEAFANPATALLRTLSMMIGDMSYDDYLNDNKFEPFSAHVIYALFLILVALILMNLLIGLAVNDIQGLQKEGRLKRLRKQAQYIIYLEDVVNNRFSKLLLCESTVKKMNSWINQEPIFTTNPSARKQRIGLPLNILEHALSIAHDGMKPVDTLTLSDTYNLVQECLHSIEGLTQRIENIESGLIGSNQSESINSAEDLNGGNESPIGSDNNDGSSLRGSDVAQVDPTDDEMNDEVDRLGHRKLSMKKSRRLTMKRSVNAELQEIKCLLREIKELKHHTSTV